MKNKDAMELALQENIELYNSGNLNPFGFTDYTRLWWHCSKLNHYTISKLKEK